MKFLIPILVNLFAKKKKKARRIDQDGSRWCIRLSEKQKSTFLEKLENLKVLKGFWDLRHPQERLKWLRLAPEEV